jgi:hypothetical protein
MVSEHGLGVAAETQTARTSGNGNAEEKVALGKVQ